MTTKKPDERHAVSDERDSAGSAGDGTDTEATGDDPRSDRGGDPAAAPHGQAVAARAVDADERRRRLGRPSTKAAADEERRRTGQDRQEDRRAGPSRNPFAFVLNYLTQVVAELRKVIWPNRKQMVSYTTVVLVFLAFMVALIGLVDLGLAKLVMLVFG